MLVLGNEAFNSGDFSRAKHFYLQARELDKNLHESYFGLAKVAFAQNDKKSCEPVPKKSI